MRDNEGTHLSFGMGADSGNVWKVGTGFLRTYVGTVINRSARIEQMTKMFASTTAVGNSLYKFLLKDFYPIFHELIEETNNYDTILNDNPEAVLVSKKFALQYVFNMPLKGIQEDAPIFRVSDSLVNDDNLFLEILRKLIGDKSSEEIKKIVY
jgi:class 3 adenylate cyclase